MCCTCANELQHLVVHVSVGHHILAVLLDHDGLLPLQGVVQTLAVPRLRKEKSERQKLGTQCRRRRRIAPVTPNDTDSFSVWAQEPEASDVHVVSLLCFDSNIFQNLPQAAASSAVNTTLRVHTTPHLFECTQHHTFLSAHNTTPF